MFVVYVLCVANGLYVTTASSTLLERTLLDVVAYSMFHDSAVELAAFFLTQSRSYFLVKTNVCLPL